MAYGGNFPGGGFSGYIKAEKPLLTEKRSYVPVKDDWPPKYGVYGEKLPETEKLPERKDIVSDSEDTTQVFKRLSKRKKHIDAIDGLDKGKDTASELDKRPTKASTKESEKTKRVTFDEKHLEDYADALTPIREKGQPQDKTEIGQRRGEDIPRKVTLKKLPKSDKASDDSQVGEKKEEVETKKVKQDKVMRDVEGISKDKKETRVKEQKERREEPKTEDEDNEDYSKKAVKKEKIGTEKAAQEKNIPKDLQFSKVAEKKTDVKGRKERKEEQTIDDKVIIDHSKKSAKKEISTEKEEITKDLELSKVAEKKADVKGQKGRSSEEITDDGYIEDYIKKAAKKDEIGAKKADYEDLSKDLEFPEAAEKKVDVRGRIGRKLESTTDDKVISDADYSKKAAKKEKIRTKKPVQEDITKDLELSKVSEKKAEVRERKGAKMEPRKDDKYIADYSKKAVKKDEIGAEKSDKEKIGKDLEFSKVAEEKTDDKERKGKEMEPPRNDKALTDYSKKAAKKEKIGAERTAQGEITKDLGLSKVPEKMADVSERKGRKKEPTKDDKNMADYSKKEEISIEKGSQGEISAEKVAQEKISKDLELSKVAKRRVDARARKGRKKEAITDDGYIEDYTKKDVKKKEFEEKKFIQEKTPEDPENTSKITEKKVIRDRKYHDDSKASDRKIGKPKRKDRIGKKTADTKHPEGDFKVSMKKEGKESKQKRVTTDEEDFGEDSEVTERRLKAKGLEKKLSRDDDKYLDSDSKTTKKEKINTKKARRPKISGDKFVKDDDEDKVKKDRQKMISDDKEKSIKSTSKKTKYATRDIEDEPMVLKDHDEVTFFPKTKISEDFVKSSDEEEEKELRVKFRRARKVPTYTYYKRKRSILRFCPCLDRLLHSHRLEYRGLKVMLGFPIGALFGFALYWIVLRRIGAERYYFWLLGTCVGIGFAVSTQVRCICLLSIPACCGRAGRAFVSTYIVAYVIEGPMTNILTNSKEAMRSISCTTSLNLNHSMERFKLMFKPVKEIVADFINAGDKVQKDTKQLENTFTEVEKEVRDENEVREAMADVEELDDEIGGDSRSDVIKKKFRKGRRFKFGEESEKKYGMKSEFRCEEIFTKGVRACYDSFGKAYDRCHSYLPIIGYLLCWPMKLTFICDLASSMMGKRSCDSDDVMNPGFGASVDTADGVQSEFDKDFAVQLQYKLIIPEERADQLVPQDISEAMKYSFERRKRNLDFFIQLVDRILAVLCLLVINSSRKYCNQYLRIIQFDNKYVTSYFRHIDARRQKKGKVVLLPLKKGEKLELSDPFSVKFSAEEKMLLIVSGLRLISELLTVAILLMFDRIFYELLDLIHRHAHVTYKQTGVHHIKMTIYGDGFVGNMVRGILKGFDKKHSADQVTTTEECLPLPVKLPRDMITRLYLVFLIMSVLILLESYALRLRRVICAFFYPKREKRRILFLYNDRLKKRRSFLRHMRHRVRKQAREQAIAMDSGVFFSLRLFYPKYFNWVTKLGLGLAQCLICSETESKKCRLISCPECPFSYCSECWKDTEEKCYACLPDDDTEPSDNSASGDKE